MNAIEIVALVAAAFILGGCVGWIISEARRMKRDAIVHRRLAQLARGELPDPSWGMPPLAPVGVNPLPPRHGDTL